VQRIQSTSKYLSQEQILYYIVSFSIHPVANAPCHEFFRDSVFRFRIASTLEISLPGGGGAAEDIDDAALWLSSPLSPAWRGRLLLLPSMLLALESKLDDTSLMLLVKTFLGRAGLGLTDL
jgi:hypothetical protein